MRIVASESKNAVGTIDRFEKWNEFVDNASVALHFVAADGIVLWANQTELNLLGYEREEYLGLHIAEFHVDQDVIENMLTQLTAGETLEAYPARLRAKDGSIKYVLVNSNVYKVDGEFKHTRCFSTPVTEATWKAVEAVSSRSGKQTHE